MGLVLISRFSVRMGVKESVLGVVAVVCVWVGTVYTELLDVGGRLEFVCVWVPTSCVEM